MSVTFSIRGSRVDLEGPTNHLNVCNTNGRDLLRWLGLPDEDLYGSLPAPELAAHCRRRLWDEPRNHDPELPGSDSWAGRLTVVGSDGTERVVGGEAGPRVIVCGRREGYLRSTTARLLELALIAGAGWINWG